MSILIYLHLQLSSSVLISLQLSSSISTYFPLSHLSRTILIVFHLFSSMFFLLAIWELLLLHRFFFSSIIFVRGRCCGLRRFQAFEVIATWRWFVAFCRTLPRLQRWKSSPQRSSHRQRTGHRTEASWCFARSSLGIAQQHWWHCAGTHESTGILTWNM